MHRDTGMLAPLVTRTEAPYTAVCTMRMRLLLRTAGVLALPDRIPHAGKGQVCHAICI